MNDTVNEMTAEDVVTFCKELDRLGIAVWLDGGWGVDALLGRQTRDHKDLDIILQQNDVEEVRLVLSSKGYRLVPRDDLSELNFHLGDGKGHEVDCTVITFDEEGNGIYGPKEDGEMNPAASFLGTGVIDGCPVRCVSAEYAIKFRDGYELNSTDCLDLAELSSKFGLPLHQSYHHYCSKAPIIYTRVYSPSELDSLTTITAEFEGRAFGYEEPDLKSYRQKLNEPHAFQLLAKNGEDKALAYLAAFELLFPKYLFIFELLVDSSAQGMGIGRSMVERAIAFAREEGLKGVYVETESWNIPAQNLYKKCGFETVENTDWQEGVTLKKSFC